MKAVRSAAIAILMATSAMAYGISTNVVKNSGHQSDVVEHGGGCRKSSPPGMCCHMDHKTGVVHCH